MKLIRIDKAQWQKGLDTLRKTYRLFGPQKEKTYHEFKELAESQTPDMSFQNTQLSPKAMVFPQSELMLIYSLDKSRDDHDIAKEAPKDYAPRAVIGLRPCDAKALMLVKLNFDTPEYQDPYWLNLFNATTFVGLACDAPCSTCFCSTAGCGPYHEEGLDVLLSDQGDYYLVKPLTDKGAKLLHAAGWKTQSDVQDLNAQKQAAEEKITSQVATDRLKELDTMVLYEADFWEDVSFACINCGTCTYVCPTCWCFDIQDEVHGKQGKRMRNWDSCMFPLFTMHTTGHNPRGTKLQRVRQRFMHKLKYFVDKYDSGIMCVGCGRCVTHCPVNIDIRKVCDLMNRYKADQACTV